VSGPRDEAHATPDDEAPSPAAYLLAGLVAQLGEPGSDYEAGLAAGLRMGAFLASTLSEADEAPDPDLLGRPFARAS